MVRTGKKSTIHFENIGTILDNIIPVKENQMFHGRWKMGLNTLKEKNQIFRVILLKFI